MRILTTAILAVFLLFFGQSPQAEEVKESVTCESFGIQIEPEEWSKVRQKMYLLAIEDHPKFADRLRFVDDSELEGVFPRLSVSIQPMDDIVTEDESTFPGTYVLSEMLARPGYAVLSLTSHSAKHCTDLKVRDYLFVQARKMFSRDWKVFDNTSSPNLTPYDHCMIDALRKRDTAEDKCLAECFENDSAGSIGGGCYHACFAHRKDRNIMSWIPPESWAQCEE